VRHGLASVESLHAGVFMVVQRFRSDLGLFVHLHALITDGAFDERADEVRFMPAATPTPERLTAVLAQVREPRRRTDRWGRRGRRRPGRPRRTGRRPR